MPKLFPCILGQRKMQLLPECETQRGLCQSRGHPMGDDDTLRLQTSDVPSAPGSGIRAVSATMQHGCHETSDRLDGGLSEHCHFPLSPSWVLFVGRCHFHEVASLSAKRDPRLLSNYKSECVSFDMSALKILRKVNPRSLLAWRPYRQRERNLVNFSVFASKNTGVGSLSGYGVKRTCYITSTG